MVENIKTRILCSINVFLKSCGLWSNVEKCRTGHATDGNMIRRMCFACWITKATNTRLECVTLTGFTRQQCLLWSDSVLRHTYSVCLLALTLFKVLLFSSEVLNSAHTAHVSAFCGSQNKERLFAYTTLTDWFL
jgi:hypothetical protein